ncbi:MAG: general secretion pathway protein GspE, partial [Methylophilales bacterium 16-45-7]
MITTTLSVHDDIVVIHATLIKQAKALALQQQRRVIEVLEELVGSNQETFLSALGACLHYSPISMKEMHTLIAGFDAIPFSKAQQKECLAFFNEDEQLTLVFADPFNMSLQEWA